MRNRRLLADMVHGQFYDVTDTLCFDLDLAVVGINDEGHGDDGLQRITLRPTRGET